MTVLRILLSLALALIVLTVKLDSLEQEYYRVGAALSNANTWSSLQTFTSGAQFGAVAFAALGTPANGVVVYCSDCLNVSNPCTGASTGAIAKRLNGAWDCR